MTDNKELIADFPNIARYLKDVGLHESASNVLKAADALAAEVEGLRAELTQTRAHHQAFLDVMLRLRNSDEVNAKADEYIAARTTGGEGHE